MVDAANLTWSPQSAWRGIAAAGHFGADGSARVRVALRDGFYLASIMTEERDAQALAQSIENKAGLILPSLRKTSCNGGVTLVSQAPHQWLLHGRMQSEFQSVLAAAAPYAAVSDQSHARAGLGLSGEAIRAVLAKGVMIDLHDKEFPVGACAATSIAHIGATFWRVADAETGAAYEFLVARSMAGSFWSWLVASAAEFGCAVSD